MTVQCQLCGYIKEMISLYPKQQIVKCPSCQLIFYAKEVKPASLYTKEYFTGNEYLDYLADRQILQRNFSRRIRKIRKFKPDGRLLELGSAFGFFLELAQAYWEVKGIDIVPEAIEYAYHTFGLNVIQVDFLTLPDEPESYDIICMWDTIEHLSHPIQTIEKANRWLKPGGILAVTTGDIESNLAQFQKENWRLIHPPTHLFYFSATTLRKAVEKVGLEVIDISYIGYYRSFKTILHGLFVLNNKKVAWIYQLLTLNGRINFPVYLNLFDIMMLIARKPNI
jgi:2-polyprenyl-3-methyl-5-hydroxy-6-metoxy-1,4-benzoquinol methylase